MSENKLHCCSNPDVAHAFQWRGEITCVNCGNKLSQDDFVNLIMSMDEPFGG